VGPDELDLANFEKRAPLNIAEKNANHARLAPDIKAAKNESQAADRKAKKELHKEKKAAAQLGVGKYTPTRQGALDDSLAP
jgi:hypothetical protein